MPVSGLESVNTHMKKHLMVWSRLILLLIISFILVCFLEEKVGTNWWLVLQENFKFSKILSYHLLFYYLSSFLREPTAMVNLGE